MKYPNYPSDLTSYQRDLLRLAAMYPNEHGSGLQERMMELYNDQVRLQTVYTNLEGLEERDLIERDEHSGKKRIWITEEGREALKQLHDFDKKVFLDF